MAKAKTAEGSAQVPARWDEELARQAQLAMGMEESTSTGAFFGLKGGILTFDKLPIANNKMAVVILDTLLENVYYKDEFDPDAMASPTCFAHGRVDKDMKPHQIVVDAKQAQSEQCHGCQWNEFGTADKGRGKACRNTRRLALIPAGTIDGNDKFTAFTKPDQFSSSVIGFMKLPVTSVKPYSAFVKQLAAVMHRPPHGIYTKIAVTPDKDTQFRVTFDALGNVPDHIMEVIMKRHDEAAALIVSPYSLTAPDEGGAKKPGTKGKATKKQSRKY